MSMSSDCYWPERECAHDLHVILRRINVKPFPHPHRLLANAPIAIDYLSHVQMSGKAYVSKPLIKDICHLWSRMKSVNQHSEYHLLEPEFSNLTYALRRAHSFFLHSGMMSVKCLNVSHYMPMTLELLIMRWPAIGSWLLVIQSSLLSSMRKACLTSSVSLKPISWTPWSLKCTHDFECLFVKLNLICHFLSSSHTLLFRIVSYEEYQ